MTSKVYGKYGFDVGEVVGEGMCEYEQNSMVKGVVFLERLARLKVVRKSWRWFSLLYVILGIGIPLL